MSLNRYAARRDATEGPLVLLARGLGALMVQAGPCDFWCGWRRSWVPVEIKSVKGTYTDAQVKFLIAAAERELTVWTWRTDEDVLRDLGAKRTA